MFQKISNLGKRQRLVFDLSLILAFSILVTLPIFFIGIPGGADMPQHFQFAATIEDSIKSGEIYPSWAMSPNNGNGDIGIRFYPPLTHYVFVLFKTVSGNWFDGFCLSIIFFFFAGGVGVYFWSREFFGESASLFGALTYIFLPYHVNQIYGAGMYGEFAAAAIVPFCFLFVSKICQKGRLQDVCCLAIFYALLILTHLPIAIISSIALGLYALFSLSKANYLAAIFKLALSVSAGLLLSSFYWSRMISELDFVKHNSETFSSGNFSYQSNFLLAKYFSFTGATLNQASSFNDTMFLVSLGIFASGAVIYFVKARETKDFRLKNVLVVMLVSLFMATPLSIKIWQNFSLLQKTQFPWRWLNLVTLGTAIFAAAAFAPTIEFFKSSKRFLSFIFAGIWLIGAAFNVTDVMNPLLTYPKDYFNSLIGIWSKMPSNDCWWTVWAKKSETRVLAFSAKLPEKVVMENRQTTIEKWTAKERIFTIIEGEAGQASVATFYYPHWKATVNGSPTEISPTEKGLISLRIPPEKSEVKLSFQEPKFVIFAFYVSGLMWILILGFLIFSRLRRDSKNS